MTRFSGDGSSSDLARHQSCPALPVPRDARQAHARRITAAVILLVALGLLVLGSLTNGWQTIQYFSTSI